MTATGSVFDACISGPCDEYPELFRECRRKAAKTYRCCECLKLIHPGESYWYACGKSGGEFWDARTCEICHRVRDSLCPDGYNFGELWGSVRDAYCVDEADAEAMIPASWLHPTKYRCEILHQQDCDACDDFDCCDNPRSTRGKKCKP